MWDQGSKGWDQGSQAIGSGSAVFLGIRDQAAPFLWDQGSKFLMLLESTSRIRNLSIKMVSPLQCCNVLVLPSESEFVDEILKCEHSNEVDTVLQNLSRWS